MSLRTRTTRTRVGALGAAVALALSLTACGDDSSSGDSTDVTVEDNPDFPADSTMAALADEGKITIGVKIDQPGIGNLEPGADAPEGLDIEMGRFIAAGLGISDDNIDWKETISDNREAFIKGGDVDLVIASYSITDDRREIVGQAGPYYVTGQQILVREEDKDKITGPDDLSGIKTCSVEGSTSLDDRAGRVRRRSDPARHLLRVRGPAQEQHGRRGDHRRRDPAGLRGRVA